MSYYSQSDPPRRGNRPKNSNNYNNYNNYSSYNNSKTYKKSYQPKPDKIIPKVNLIGSTNYLSHTSQDVIYLKTMHRLINSQNKVFIHQQLANLNLLLYMTTKDFWKQLQSSQKLRLALEGCLESFSQKQYNVYIHKQNFDQISQQKHKIQSANYDQYEKYMEIVLKVYYRIVFQAQGDKQKIQIIYNNWILDIPKLIQLICVYKSSNPKIVKAIVFKCFQINPNYSYDFSQFLQTISKSIIPLLYKDLGFKIDMNNLKANNFANKDRSFLRNFIKTVFFVNQFFILLDTILQYFPDNQINNLAADYDIMKQAISIHSIFTHKLKNQWVLKKQIFLILKPVLDKYWQNQNRYFQKIFKKIKTVFKTGKTKYFFDTVKTYLEIGKAIKNKITKQNNYDCQIIKYFIKTVNNIIKREKQQNIFVETNQIRLMVQKQKCQISQEDIKLIDNLVKFQKEQRNQLITQSQIQPYDQLLENFIPYKEWFNLNQKQKSEQQQITRNGQNIQQIVNKKRKQMNKALAMYRRQYDDEPDFQQEQISFKKIELPNQWKITCIEFLKIQQQPQLDLSVRLDKDQQYENNQDLSYIQLNQCRIRQNNKIMNNMNLKNKKYQNLNEQFDQIRQISNISKNFQFSRDEQDCSLQDNDSGFGYQILNDLNFNQQQMMNKSLQTQLQKQEEFNNNNNDISSFFKKNKIKQYQDQDQDQDSDLSFSINQKNNEISWIKNNKQQKYQKQCKNDIRDYLNNRNYNHPNNNQNYQYENSRFKKAKNKQPETYQQIYKEKRYQSKNESNYKKNNYRQIIPKKEVKKYVQKTTNNSDYSNKSKKSDSFKKKTIEEQDQNQLDLSL